MAVSRGRGYGVERVGRNNAQQGHIDLAKGQPVAAAGEVAIVHGKLKSLDNKSGHYKPSGKEAQSAAEEAFQRHGFDTEGKYQEKSFK